MKILLISDTHMFNDVFDEINKKHNDCDLYIHCGDSSLPLNSPYLRKYYVVKGNHDDANYPLIINLEINKIKIMITHGHKLNVYSGYDEILKHDFDFCFHGHTHVPNITKFNNKVIINPGSSMINRGNFGFGTYAIIEIDTNKSFKIIFYETTSHKIIRIEDYNDEINNILNQFKKAIN